MEAQAGSPQCVGAAGVFGEGASLGAVGKQHDAVAAVRVGDLFDAPAQAFFGEQPADEVEVAFAVLGADTARPGTGKKRHDLVAHRPGGIGGVAGKHGFDDLKHGLVLPEAAGEGLRQAPQPRHQPHPVTRQAAVAAELGELVDEAGERGARAVAQADVQTGGLAEQGFKVDVGVGGEDDNVARADGVHRLDGNKGFDQQAARAEVEGGVLRVFEGEFVEAFVAGEPRQNTLHLLQQGRSEDGRGKVGHGGGACRWWMVINTNLPLS